MILTEIINAFEKVAPPALQEHYDNSGLLVGDQGMEIDGALLCIDATEQVIDEALQNQCNLVIAHHPIIFSGLKKITGKTYVERAVIKAIRNGIAIYAAHTNLDNVRNGVNSKICQRLGIQHPAILSPASNQLKKLYTFVPHQHTHQVREALFAAGAGTIGEYDECSFNTEGFGTFKGTNNTHPFYGEAGIRHTEMETRVEMIFPSWLQDRVISVLKKVHPYEEVAYDIVNLDNKWENQGAGMIGNLEQPMNIWEFFKSLKDKMNVKVIRHTYSNQNTNTGDAIISSVAVCGGAGSFLLKDAIAKGAHIFITADFKYHQFFDAEEKIIIADIGHYESEQFTTEIFAAVLRHNFPTFALRFSNVNTNPINYF